MLSLWALVIGLSAGRWVCTSARSRRLRDKLWIIWASWIHSYFPSPSWRGQDSADVNPVAVLRIPQGESIS